MIYEVIAFSSLFGSWLIWPVLATFWITFLLVLFTDSVTWLPQVLGFSGYSPWTAALAYLVLGLLYGTLRWVHFVFAVRNWVQEVKKSKDASGNALYKWQSWSYTRWASEAGDHFNSTGDLLYIPPTLADNKSRFSTWVFYWPLSLAVFTLGNLVLGNLAPIFTSVWNLIVTLISRPADSISDSVMGDILPQKNAWKVEDEKKED